MKHLFIINPHSFSDKLKLKKAIAEIKHFFADKNPHDVKLYITLFPRDALIETANFLKKMDDEDMVRVYAAGGNGTLFDCLNGIMSSEKKTELASVPYGSANEFLYSFLESQKHHRWKIGGWRSIENQINSKTIPVDIIKCNNNYALNYCSIGVEPNTYIKINNIINWKDRKYRRFIAKIYMIFRFLSAFEALANNRVYKVKIDGENLDGRYIGINVVNGKIYAYNRFAIEGTAPDDGKLDVLLIKAAPVFNLLTTYNYYTRGQWLEDGSVFIYRKAEKIEISAEETLAVSIDGEIFYETNLEISVLPGKLNFVKAKN